MFCVIDTCEAGIAERFAIGQGASALLLDADNRAGLLPPKALARYRVNRGWWALLGCMAWFAYSYTHPYIRRGLGSARGCALATTNQTGLPCLHRCLKREWL